MWLQKSASESVEADAAGPPADEHGGQVGGPPHQPARWSRAPDLNLTLPVGASQLSFADMDADGLVDILFMTPGTVHVWYAQSTPPGEADPNSTCAAAPQPTSGPGQLCAARSGWRLSFFRRAFALPHGWQMGDGGAGEAASAGLPARPTTLSVADFFLDGYPEVLLPLAAPANWLDAPDFQAGCRPGQRCLALLHNDEELRCQEGSDLEVHTAAEGSSTTSGSQGRAGHGISTARVIPLLAGPSMGVFIDLFEDGVWDVLTATPNGTISAWRQPPGSLDNYFLKVVTSDGACAPSGLDGADPEPLTMDALRETGHSVATRLLGNKAGGEPAIAARNGTRAGAGAGAALGTGEARCAKMPKAKGLMAGVNQPGVSYQFLTTMQTRWGHGSSWSLNRPKQQRVATQLQQSAYAPLLAPYALIGIGQTHDYVEELAAGLPSGQVRSFQQAIIPNSRLVVLPHPFDDTDEWEIRLYLEPRQQHYVFFALCATLATIGVMALVLEICERVQDSKERKALAPALPL